MIRLPPERIWKGTGENAAAGVPVDLELGVVEVDTAVGALAVIEIAGIGGDTSGKRLRDPVRTDHAAQARRHRHIELQSPVAEPGRQQQVVGGNLAGLERDAAVPVVHRLDRCGDPPRTGRIRRTDGDHDAAAVRTLDAQADIFKGPSLAGALVVDGQRAVFQSELAQIVAVEPGLADAVEPRQQGGDAVGGRPRQRGAHRRRGDSGARGAESAGGTALPSILSCLMAGRMARPAAAGTLAVAIGCLSVSEANTVTRPSGSMRTAIVGADQIEALGAHMAAEQT